MGNAVFTNPLLICAAECEVRMMVPITKYYRKRCIESGEHAFHEDDRRRQDMGAFLLAFVGLDPY